MILDLWKAWDARRIFFRLKRGPTDLANGRYNVTDMTKTRDAILFKKLILSLPEEFEQLQTVPPRPVISLACLYTTLRLLL